MRDAVKPGSIEDFEQRYRVKPTEVTRQIERAAIGGDWGANGYTTVNQADRLGRELSLGPGSMLLDLGAGRGMAGPVPSGLDRVPCGHGRCPVRRFADRT
jgi:hypothetical protein